MDESHTTPTAHVRGWGPFTGGQLTIIIVAIVVMVLFPIGAWAVSGSNTFITDATTGQRALVNSTGSLNVAQASPKSFFVRAARVTSGNVTRMFAADSHHAFIITTVDISTTAASTVGGGRGYRLFVSKGGDTCSHPNYLPGNLGAVNVTPLELGSQVVTMQPGVVVPANRALCGVADGYPDIAATLTVYGFFVPAASAPREP